jgi:FtsH-binding integral membrane protein
MFSMNEALTAQNVMNKVYAWMCIGLVVTAAVSYGLLSFPELFNAIFSSKWHLYGIFALQLGLVVYISAFINQISYGTAAFAFMLYSFLMGLTLAPIFIMYQLPSIALTFVCTAGMFGSMAVYGSATNTDLSKMGNIMLMALWGMIIASFANWYFQSSALQYGIAFMGVIVFTALTAYDVQKIKQLMRTVEYQGDHGAYREMVSKVALLGALTLYLDFVNLFLSLLQLMGRKRD